jgi:hypothetical protein
MEMAKRTIRTVRVQITYGVGQVVEADNNTPRLQALKRIECALEMMLRQEPTMTLKEASAAWMADHLSRDGVAITVHRACHGKETHDMCPDCRHLVLSARQKHQVIKTEALDKQQQWPPVDRSLAALSTEGVGNQERATAHQHGASNPQERIRMTVSYTHTPAPLTTLFCPRCSAFKAYRSNGLTYSCITCRAMMEPPDTPTTYARRLLLWRESPTAALPCCFRERDAGCDALATHWVVQVCGVWRMEDALTDDHVPHPWRDSAGAARGLTELLREISPPVFCKAHAREVARRRRGISLPSRPRDHRRRAAW